MLTTLLHRLVAHPKVYDAVQVLLGFAKTRQRLVPYFRQFAGRSVIEIGAGTGLWRGLMPRSTSYVWVDNDAVKLQGFLAKPLSARAMLADISRLGLRDN